ncbi:MAG: BlaI/MecI/CopY family transcriptional regulator [Rhodothermales bacterium]
MARKKSSTLTDAELRLMEIVWDRGPSTVQDVVDALPADTPLAYSTVLTMLRILEQKAYLTHKKDGRAYVYESVVEKGEAQRGALQHLMKRFFDDSPELLVLNLMENSEFDAADLERLKSMIDSAPDEDAS